MVNVSKVKLPKSEQDRLFKQFANVIAKLNTSTAGDFLGALLSDKEKIMLAKRVASIVMMHEKCSLYMIWNTLNLSPTTVVSMYKNYQAGEYAHIVNLFRNKKKDREQLWEILGLISRGGLPPMGKGRWKPVLKMIKN